MSKRKVTDKIVTAFILISAMITVGALVWILAYIIINGAGHIDWKFISTVSKGKSDGILSMIVTTVYVISLSLIIATPIGICSAVYLVEYARPGRIVRIIRFATESLAGIPSIIYGLFGMIFFGLLHINFTILAGGITVSIMVLPTIIRTTEEALKAVPVGYREGSFGLGASKLRTISNIVLPSAMPGILTAVILSIGRVVGETAALCLTAGTVTRMPRSIMESGQTLSVHLYLLAKEGISFEKAFATATVLIVVVALINFVAGRMAAKLTKA